MYAVCVCVRLCVCVCVCMYVGMYVFHPPPPPPKALKGGLCLFPKTATTFCTPQMQSSKVPTTKTTEDSLP